VTHLVLLSAFTANPIFHPSVIQCLDSASAESCHLDSNQSNSIEPSKQSIAKMPCGTGKVQVGMMAAVVRFRRNRVS
jgi:hypothetical protein